jgi:hypothetical protein
MDDATRDTAVWFKDEEICGSLQFRKETWRIAQRKIAKKATNVDTYFTMAMLNAVGMVCKGIRGINPDKPIGMVEVSQSSFLKDRLGGTLQRVNSAVDVPPQALI